MLKKFLASILAPIIADELQKTIERMEDIESSINSSLADIKDEMDDIRHSVDEIDPYNIGSNIAEYVDTRQIARDIADNMDDPNSDNWDDLWKSLTTVENQLKEIMKALNIQTDNQ
jgi:cell division protein ZapA (FtsZ GTPase activity inhibitor)